MEESSPMTGGDGAYSYAKNSQFQKQAVDSAKEMIQDAIMEKHDTEIHLSVASTLAIADYGCSVGPNTFYTVQNLLESVENKCSLQGLDCKNIEFQVYFSDQVGNDFNTLFASLPLDRKYHAAGVPGSFYGRLFPRASISLAHSAYALQWLSKVPEGVYDSKSAAWNGGRIHYVGASKDVVNAYSEQFDKDMGVFMRARAEEIVRGGLMFLFIPALPDGVCHSQHPGGVYYDSLASSLMELAEEGIIEKAEIETFNLPLYFPTVGEMTKLVEKNGSFSIESKEVTYPGAEIDICTTLVHLRSAMEGTFTKHFGETVAEKMFAKTLAKAEQISLLLEAVSNNFAQLFLVLKRK